MLKTLSLTRLRSFAAITLLALQDAFEHPVGQAIVYGALLSILPPAYWPMLLGVCLGITMAHELAHWAVARWLGFKIDTFSVGLPFSKSSFGLAQVGATRVQITPYWLFGGFVSFDPTAKEVLKAPAWKRASVMAAGPAMNLLLAVLLFAGSYQLSGKEIYHGEIPVVYQLNSGATPAAKAGLLPGDLLKAVNGSHVSTSEELNQALSRRQSNELTLEAERQGELKQFKLELEAGKPLGFSLGRYDYVPATARESLSAGTKQTGTLLAEIRDALLRLVHLKPAAPAASGDAAVEPAVNGVHSIIAFVKVGAAAYQQGLANFLYLLGVISLNLAVLNILPLPLLDGGHLLFLAIEKLRGKPVSAKTQERWSMVFLAVFAGLFLLGLYNDYYHPIS